MRAAGALIVGSLLLAGCSGSGDARVTEVDTANVDTTTVDTTSADRTPVTARVRNFGRFCVQRGTKADVAINRSGTYTICYEYKREVDGETVDAAPEPPDDLEVSVLDADDNELSVLTPPEIAEYSDEPFAGVSVRTVEFELSGDYVIRASGGDEPLAIAIGRGTVD